jgi:hypothetical protein
MNGSHARRYASDGDSQGRKFSPEAIFLSINTTFTACVVIKVEIGDLGGDVDKN